MQTAVPDSSGGAIVLRTHRAGDVGWIIHRHGVLYADEYGWDQTFEAAVAEVGADFLRHFDPSGERCWIAEVDGRPAGSVMLIRRRHHEGVAQLRLLLVEPHARGIGLGRTLVRACTDFACAVGYRSIVLWTSDRLLGARRLYEQEGYRLVETRPHDNYGQNMTGEVWEKPL